VTPVAVPAEPSGGDRATIWLDGSDILEEHPGETQRVELTPPIAPVEESAPAPPASEAVSVSADVKSRNKKRRGGKSRKKRKSR
jgi:hypothetical protein